MAHWPLEARVVPRCGLEICVTRFRNLEPHLRLVDPVDSRVTLAGHLL